jgi:hypothetical protein
MGSGEEDIIRAVSTAFVCETEDNAIIKFVLKMRGVTGMIFIVYKSSTS